MRAVAEEGCRFVHGDLRLGEWMGRRQSIHGGSGGLERNGYSGRTLIGAMPNIRRNVREKCAESAKPAESAASVRESPPT